MKPLASVILPVLNEEKNLGECLSAVFSQETDFRFEVIVVDSGSTDRSREIAREFARSHPLILLELSREEFGHGRTRQLASLQAEGEYLVYLVADAVPADKHWLSRLLDSARKDERVAGVYSRQIHRQDADLISRIRLKKRKVSSLACSENELKNPFDYWMMSPLERILFCDFDDVSSLRKRSVLEKIPIRDCVWAEDLVWSKECLLNGYKIVYEPSSVVYHSHRSRAFYFFQRGWLDQKSAEEFFGQHYYPSAGDALRGFLFSARELIREILTEDAKWTEKCSALFKAPVVCSLEVAGRYFAGLKLEKEASFNLWERFSRAKILPESGRVRAAKTSFTIGDKWQRVILAHPFVIINYMVNLPESSELKLGIGIKPEAFNNRSEPIDFMVAVNGEPILRERLEMAPENLKGWKEFVLDLSLWSGRSVKISLVTASEDLRYAWAGWAEPRIIFKSAKDFFNWRNFVIRSIETLMGMRGFRHP